jgi:hypothetical protein
MIYLSGTDCKGARELGQTHDVGLIPQPRSYGPAVTAAYPHFALDNGCVKRGPDGLPIPNPKWNEKKWLRWLDRMPRETCLFAVVPDVVGDAEATLDRWEDYGERVASMGFKTAFVLQNGQDYERVPEEAYAVFVGGDTAFKLGIRAAHLTMTAHHKGQWVHMGRCNSFKRIHRAAETHCDSCDGNFLIWSPDANVPRLRAMLDQLPADQQLALA